MREEDLSYFEKEEFKKNLALYEAMLNGGPSVYLESDELTDIAEYYLSHHNEDKANACIDYALALHPNSTDPLIFKARQHLFAGDIEQAEHVYQLIEDKNEREAIFIMTEILLAKQDYTGAQAFLDDRKSLFSDNNKDLYDYLIDSAGLLCDYRRNKEALHLIQEAESIGGITVDTVLLQVDILQDTDRHQEAVHLLECTLKEHPYWIKCWDALAETYFMQEMYEQAIEAADFSLAIQEHGNLPALATKANSFYSLDNYEKAHQLYLQYINEKDTDSEMPYFYDGMCLIHMELFEDACKQLEMAQQLSQDCSSEQLQIYLQLAFTYSKLGRLDSALLYLDKAYDLEPDKFQYEVLKGHMHLENGLSDEAKGLFKQALEKKPMDNQTLFLIGTSYFETQHYQEALQYFDQIYTIGLTEEIENTLYPYKAYCYYCLKDKEGYLTNLKWSCEHNPSGTKAILGHLFPDSLPPGEYYNYLIQRSRMK